MIGAIGRSNWPSRNPNFNNQTALALTAGMIVEIDLLGLNANSTPTAAQTAAGVVAVDLQLDNAVVPTSTGITSGVPYAVVTTPAVAATAGQRFNTCIEGPVLVNVNGAVNIGDNLIPVAGQTYLQTDFNKGPALAVAKALQANTSGAGQIQALFKGDYGRMNQGSV